MEVKAEQIVDSLVGITFDTYSCNDPSQHFSVENPGTSRIMATIQSGNAFAANKAVQASRVAFGSQNLRSHQNRRSRFSKAAGEFQKKGHELKEPLYPESREAYMDPALDGLDGKNAFIVFL